MTSGGDTDTVAWSVFLAEGVRRLEAAGIESPQVDARRIIEAAAGVEPAELHTVLGRPATVRGVSGFDSMLTRRELGEPLQYVLGKWGFRYLDLMVDRRVLIPRPETEVVAGLAVAEVQRRSSLGRSEVRVVDLGTGSGAIGLSVASECGRARVFLTDVSDDALGVAGSNLSGIGCAATKVSIHAGSWFDALGADYRGTFDVIVSNPPYIADDEDLPAVVGDWEPEAALRAGPTGAEALLWLVGQSVEWLRPDGVLILEMAPHQTLRIAQACAALGFIATVHPDLSGRDRAVMARLVP